MDKSLIECNVSKKDKKVCIPVSNFDQLLREVQTRFRIESTTSFEIHNEDDAEIDSAAFDFLSGKSQKLHLKLIVSESVVYRYRVYNGNNPNSSRVIPILVESTKTLKQLSDIILERELYNNLAYICSFYSSSGEPLISYIEGYNYITCSDVIDPEDEIFVLITQNRFKIIQVNEACYERSDKITMKSNNGKVTEIFVNFNRDTGLDAKKLLGIELHVPDYLIKLTKDYQESQKISPFEHTIEYFISYDYFPILNSAEFNTFIEQSKKGLEIYRNFMYCLGKHKTPYKKKIIACLRHFSQNFTPLIYSLYLLIEKSQLTMTETIALDEGILMTFINILGKLNIQSNSKLIFEKTLEIFGFILEICKLNTFDLDQREKITKIDNSCIFSHDKLTDPIKVPKNDGTFELVDKESIKKMIDTNFRMRNFDGYYEKLPIDLPLKKKIKRKIGSNSIYIIETVYYENYNMDSQIIQLPQIFVLDNLNEFASKHKITSLTSYLDLPDPSFQYTLTRYHEGLANPKYKYTMAKDHETIIVVNLGLNECSNDKIELLNVIKNQNFKCLINSLSVLYENSKTNENLNQETVFSREPVEAIAILIDTSGSMLDKFLGTDKPKILIAKDFFNSFANRTMGYNLHHVVSLTAFDSTVKIISNFTENILKFCKVLENISPQGSTSIWTAIHSAATDLVKFKRIYPKILTRIIVLSDGYDNTSEKKPLDILKLLISENIILDSINFEENSKCLKGLSLSSGGFAFFCKTQEEGYKIFESESFLSLVHRFDPIKKLHLQEENLSSDSFLFSEIPPPVKQPLQINYKVQDINLALVNFKIVKRMARTSINSFRFKRIMKELANINKNPHPDIRIFPCEDDLEFWKGIIKGPSGTPYENGRFQIYLVFPDEYPAKPPEVRFITPIFHCNINSAGRVCISVLGHDYHADYSIKKILECIFGLFMHSEGTDSIDTNVAAIFNHNRAEFNRIATEWTRTKANKSEEELLPGLNEAEESDGIPEEYKCPITKKLMEDPVISIASGITYEKAAIINYFNSNGKDPKGKEPNETSIAPLSLIPNLNLAKTIQKFKLYRK